MKKTLLKRATIMTAGILAAIVIVFSQSFHIAPDKKLAKEKTEQQSQEVSISAPDAFSQPNTGVQLDEQVPSCVQEELTPEKKRPSFSTAFPRLVTRYFKVLFRTVISSNAP